MAAVSHLHPIFAEVSIVDKPLYPVLSNLINRIADYEIGHTGTDPNLKSQDQWEWPANAGELEVLAAVLTSEQRELLLQGEDNETLPQDLQDFLNEVYDGQYTKCFFNAVSSFERR